MDPDETLRMIHDFISRGDSGLEVDHWVEDLRLWIASGGFSPTWAQYPLGESYYRSRMAHFNHHPRQYFNSLEDPEAAMTPVVVD